MKTFWAVFFLGLFTSAVFAAPIRPALDTTLRGANGIEAAFRVVGIWADGFHIQPSPTRPAQFVSWDKVDTEWLATQRPDIVKLKASAKPFPVLSPKDAQAKLDAARKLFRAPREVSYVWNAGPNGTPALGTSPNVLAVDYAAKLRRLTPGIITDGLRAIIIDRDRDLKRLENSRGADAAQRLWLHVNFARVLVELEKVQSEIDPLNAGVLAISAPSVFPNRDPESDWF